MRRPSEIRTPPATWIPVLRESYSFLRNAGVGDLLLYGSQALSVYMKYPLRSKDIDLVSTQIPPRLLDELTQRFTSLSEIPPKNTVTTRVAKKRLSRTYSIYLRIQGYPIVIEIFDSVLDGEDPRILREHVKPVRRWKLDLFAPTPEAVVVLRLSFRPQERISRLNAVRLNRFIMANRSKLRFRQISQLIDEWGTRELIRENLRELFFRHKMRIVYDKKIEPEIHALMRPNTRR